MEVGCHCTHFVQKGRSHQSAVNHGSKDLTLICFPMSRTHSQKTTRKQGTRTYNLGVFISPRYCKDMGIEDAFAPEQQRAARFQTRRLCVGYA